MAKIATRIRYEAGTKTLRSVPENYWLASVDTWDKAVDEAGTAELMAKRYNILADIAVEVSAVQEADGDVQTVNDAPATATAVAVYIRAPIAFHLRDFPVAAGMRWEAARDDAWRWALALAEHLGCDIASQLPAPPRFVVEPQRDTNGPALASVAGTCFERCEEAAATQWAVYRYDAGVMHGDADLVEDYPTRAAAEAAKLALERGEALPDPVWPDDVRDMLEARGYGVEGGGAGNVYMTRAYPGNGADGALGPDDVGALIAVSAIEGDEFPTRGDWIVTLRPGHIDTDAIVAIEDEHGLTLEQALSIVEAAAPAVAEF